jgi:hypothetical protein
VQTENWKNVNLFHNFNHYGPKLCKIWVIIFQKTVTMGRFLKNPEIFQNLTNLTVWKGKFWQFEKGNFDSLKRKILTVWKRKFWQFGKGNFDSLEREILTVWKGKFWQFKKGNFDSLEKEILTVWKRKILTVWKGKFWQFEKGNFDSLEKEILTVWKGKFWQFEETTISYHFSLNSSCDDSNNTDCNFEHNFDLPYPDCCYQIQSDNQTENCNFIEDFE